MLKQGSHATSLTHLRPQLVLTCADGSLLVYRNLDRVSTGISRDAFAAESTAENSATCGWFDVADPARFIYRMAARFQIEFAH